MANPSHSAVQKSGRSKAFRASPELRSRRSGLRFNNTRCMEA
ncbi:hypothetical protein V6Z12_D07G175800 [Gossypium hirsutum]